MWIVSAVLLVLLGILSHQLWLSEERGVGQVRLLERAVSEQKEENARLAERNSALEAEVKNLKIGMEAIEERARTELGMIRQGETFFHILEEMPPGLALEQLPPPPKRK